jgi:hypothetical protein
VADVKGINMSGLGMATVVGIDLGGVTMPGLFYNRLGSKSS